MVRSPEREKSSKRTRDDRKDRDREKDHKHRSSHRDSDHHHHHHHRPRHRSDREGSRDEYEHRREKSYDSRDEREGSRDRGHERESKREKLQERRSEREIKREKSYDDRELERERSVDRRHKRKERAESEERVDGGDKRVRVSEEEGKKEKRRFEDRRVKDEENGDVEYEVKINNEVSDKPFRGNAQNGGTATASGAEGNGALSEPFLMSSRNVPEASVAHIHAPSTKVSSISTTNENKGVNITGSHEVTGKSSTDGSSSTAAKSGSLSLDALAKAKKALQMQKELSEKLKKIPLLNKGAPSNSDGNEGPKLQSSVAGTAQGPAAAAASASSGTTSMLATLPAAAASASSSAQLPTAGVPNLAGLANSASLEAVRRAQELAAKMGFRQDPQFGPLINLFPGQMPPEVTVAPKPTKAPVLRLDALGREIDEHGNVVNVTKPSNLSTLKVNINKQKKDSFQILKPELEVDPEKNPHFDARMGINKNKLLRPKRMTFQFVEEGKWSKEAEMLKLKSQFGEARAKEQKAKQAQLAKAKAAPDINPNLIEVGARVVTKEKQKDPIPEVEWWDAVLLHLGTYGDLNDGAVSEDKLKIEKITIYVEHPRPIEPPAESAPPPPQPLKLTKKEQKKLRTQRRLAREKEKQEMIRQGLLEPPKPKVKLSNLMKVLGSEATQDPTRLEKEIRTAAAEREQAHIDRNIARKLTPAERREKKERKLFDDPNTLETIVSVYKINDLSHPQTRFKVDVNAQENRLTGCAVICDGISVVVVEGGGKSIKRYGKLMLRRINWASAVKEDDEEEEEDEQKPVNKCLLVWQGSVAKPSFNRFSVHECMTEAGARKILSDAGVGHYWDLAVNFSEE